MAAMALLSPGDSPLNPLTDDDCNRLLSAMHNKALATDQRILVAEFMTGRSLTCKQAGMLLEAVKLGLMQRMLAFEVLHGRLSDFPDGLPYVLEHLSGPIRRDVEAGLKAPVGKHFRRLAPRNHTLRRAWSEAVPLSYNLQSNATPIETLPLQKFHSELTVASVGSAPGTPHYHPADNASSHLLNRWGRASNNSVPSFRNDGRVPECVDRLRATVSQGNVSGPLYEDLKTVFDVLGLGPLPPPSATSSDAGVPRPPGQPRPFCPEEPEDLDTRPTAVRFSMPSNSTGAHRKNEPISSMRPKSAGSHDSEESV